MSPTPFHPDEVNALIRTRRSVFVPQFEAGKIIPDDIIWQLLENANWAPTHKLSGITYSEAAKAFFGLGPADKLLGFFHLGYVRVPAPAGKRGPVQDKVTWVSA